MPQSIVSSQHKSGNINISPLHKRPYFLSERIDIYKYHNIDNSYLCAAGSANVKPGGTYGQEYYWDIADDATQIKACVESVKFVDGTTWENPYLEYWLKSER